MGKGQQGKGKPGQKPNNKFKQRTPQNIKQLAKVDKILQGRSPSSNSKKPREGSFDKNKKTYDKGKKSFGNNAGNKFSS